MITGRDKGKEGRVLRVIPNDGKVLVEHVMLVKKHVRPNPQRNIKGGIAEQESAIAISNVQLVCGTCGPVRIGPRSARRPQGPRLQEVRNDAGQVSCWLMVFSRARQSDCSNSRTGTHSETVREGTKHEWRKLKQQGTEEKARSKAQKKREQAEQKQRRRSCRATQPKETPRLQGAASTRKLRRR